MLELFDHREFEKGLRGGEPSCRLAVHLSLSATSQHSEAIGYLLIVVSLDSESGHKLLCSRRRRAHRASDAAGAADDHDEHGDTRLILLLA
jgi:hypothetical protein